MKKIALSGIVFLLIIISACGSDTPTVPNCDFTSMTPLLLKDILCLKNFRVFGMAPLVRLRQSVVSQSGSLISDLFHLLTSPQRMS